MNAIGRLRWRLRKKINGVLIYIVSSISHKLYFNLVYFKHRGHFPNLKNPKDLSEIILSQLLSGEIKDYAIYADKVRVRDFWEEWGYGEYLPKLYAVWDSADKIDFISLPNSFALKVNNGCGSHYFCQDKSKLDENAARVLMKKNLLRKWEGRTESQYSLIKPLCFAEEFLSAGEGIDGLNDFKFICCDGEIKCIQCCTDRTPDFVMQATYDINWNRLDYIRTYTKTLKEIPRPKSLEKMVEIASDVAKKFKQVRVDFFELPNGKMYIGELTFSANGGVLRAFTNEAVKKMGFTR